MDINLWVFSKEITFVREISPTYLGGIFHYMYTGVNSLENK